jgi:UDP:flavonoid glycosyltransferase YjiC (YdhE family)
MRILFVTSPGVGHVQPVMGLALAARNRGHEIAWATSGDLAPLLEAQSIHVFAVGAPFAKYRTEYRTRWPEALQLKGRQTAAHAFPRLFGNVIANDMLPGLERTIVEWKPNLVVNETGAVATPLAARKFGIPHLTHAFGLPIPASVMHEVGNEFAAAWRIKGYDTPEFAGLYDFGAVEISAPSLLAACPNPVLAKKVFTQRPSSVTSAPSDRLSESLSEFLNSRASIRAQRPIVYVTFGTLYNNNNASFTSVLNVAPKINATFVVTTGYGGSAHCDAYRKNATSGNLWIGEYVPQDLLLPLCDIVVSHAGSGTLTGAMSHGLPQLCLPQGADQFRNADALAACAAGLTLEPEDQSELTIANSIERLIRDPLFRKNAHRLRKEIDAMPTRNDVMTAIEDM